MFYLIFICGNPQVFLVNFGFQEGKSRNFIYF